MQQLVSLRPVAATDAQSLFRLIFRTPISDTLAWDGPESLDDLRASLSERELKTKRGELHQFTIIETGSKQCIGSIDIRPYANSSGGPATGADMGLWIGELFQGRGYGAAAVADIVAYGFEKLNLQNIEAKIFVGNFASRRIFEKNGFQFVETLPAHAVKRGQKIDEWLMRLSRP